MSYPTSQGDVYDDAGMTLIEVLVALGLLVVLGTLLLGLGLSTARVTDSTREAVDVNEEARVALERLSRELRQAQTVVAVEPVGGQFIGIRFEADFNGDGVINGPVAATASPSPTATAMAGETEPEILAYEWNSSEDELTLTDGSVSPPVTQPILAAKVTDFSVALFSSKWAPLPSTPALGTTWAELEAGTPDPDPNGWWSPTQLAEVDRASVSMTVAVDGVERTYTTDVSLRNARVYGGPDGG